jgi:SAM-dependent methyltransferase
MPFAVDIVVISEAEKCLGPDVEVMVVRPLPDPLQLPWHHRRLFADRRDDYDLYIYSEDDMLITQHSVDAFLEATNVLEADELAGFMRIESGADGTSHCLDVAGPYRWLPESVRTRGGDTYAVFTTEHSACFFLTREQLRKAIDSGGFRVEPHANRYDLLIEAATDPYTRCGFTKVVNVSRLPSFQLQHLSNRYATDNGGSVVEQWIPQADMDLLTTALQDPVNRTGTGPLIPPETRVPRLRWSKNLYDRPDADLLDVIGRDPGDVLVVGCGWGRTEGELVDLGARVTALPIDPVLGAAAAARGVEVLCGELDSAPATLQDRAFDTVVFPWVLHLLPDPAAVLKRFAGLARPGGNVVIAVPNLADLGTTIRRVGQALRAERRGVNVSPLFAYRLLGSYDRSGVQVTSGARLRRWVAAAGLDLQDIRRIVPGRRERYRRWLPVLAERAIADTLIASARPRSRPVNDGSVLTSTAESWGPVSA